MTSKYLEEARQVYLTNTRGLKLEDLNKLEAIEEIQREVLESAMHGEKLTRLPIFADMWAAEDIMRLAVEMGYCAHIESDQAAGCIVVVIYWSLK